MSDGCQNYDRGQQPFRRTEALASGSSSATGSASKDVMRHSLPRKENHELAEDLLARFPGLDRAALLKEMVAHYFYDLKWGNKREERAACDFLNQLQREAVHTTKTPNDQAHPQPGERAND